MASEKEYENSIQDIENSKDVLRNQYRKKEVRLERALEEINDLENKVSELESRGILDLFRKKIKMPMLNRGRG